LSVTAVLSDAFAQGLDGTPHDLTALDDDQSKTCIYCHTPPGAGDDNEPPLWSRQASGATYRTFDSATIDGEVLAVGSVSAACLTCHDGSQAVDAAINAPIKNRSGPAPGTGPRAISPIRADIRGDDLRNDHPIGIQYAGFNPGDRQIDADFINADNGLQNAFILGATRWWVDTEEVPNAIRDKSDMILYTRQFEGIDQPFVECATCHDPHSASDSEPHFMRVSNSGSAVCLSCHIK
jgi:predicted CXXCH cytochrome family protein